MKKNKKIQDIEDCDSGAYIDPDYQEIEDYQDESEESEGDFADDYFVLQSANDALEEGKNQPEPRNLWKQIWFENEILCLFSDSNLGKSILAVQIAQDVAYTEKVLYFDFELSVKQFQRRYTDDQGNLHRFPDNLVRVRKQMKNRTWERFDNNVIMAIEQALLKSGVKIAIIDNITFISDKLEDGDAAMNLMRRFIFLKEKYNFSFLIVAHTPKHFPYSPITENDLSGSKKLYNSFDSVMAIGRSILGRGKRYLKTLKQRSDEVCYDEHSVLCCHIAKKGAFLYFEFDGVSPEREHLSKPSRNNQQYVDDVMKLYSEGHSTREIGELLNSNKSTVNRVINEHKNDPKPQKSENSEAIINE